MSAAITDDTTSLPLSPTQAGLWLLHQLAPDSAAYHDVLAVRLRGPLRESLLQRCLDELTDRHDALRLRFHLTGDGPVQSALPGFRHSLEVLDVGARRGDADADAVMEAVRNEARRPFDLEAGPPARMALVRSAPDDHVLLVVLHHLISDGSSVMLLLGELAELYTAWCGGTPPPLPAPAASYLDFVRWQRERLTPKRTAAHVEYWRAHLAGAPALLELPADRARGRAPSFRGATLRFELGRELTDGTLRLAHERGVTPFMVLLAALDLLLARSSGQEDVTVGVPITHRLLPRFRPVVGNLANTLAMRARLTGDPTFGELLQRVRTTAIGAYAHAALPFERVVAALNPPRSASVHPLFQVALSFRGGLDPSALEATSYRMGELAVELLPVDAGGSRFDLAVCAQDTTLGLGFNIEYRSDLFDAATVQRLAGHLETLLADAVRDPDRRTSQMRMLTAPERRRLLRDWNDTAAEYPRELCVHELFERQVDRTPDAVAVRVGDDRVSYARLEADANRLAGRLRQLGAGPEGVVAILADHSLEAVVAMLAVLKAGAAYVAADACQPWARTSGALRELGVRLVVANAALASSIAADGLRVVTLDGGADGVASRPGERLVRTAAPRNLAFVITTSGSTGRPKSVGIEHAGAVSLLAWARRTYSDDELSGVLAATSACFDCTLFELFAPLSWGGTAVLAPSALELADLPAAGDVRVVSTVPSIMIELLERGRLPASVRTVNLAGEPLTPALAGRLHAEAGGRRVHNLYGPSEATTYATMAAVSGGCDRVTVGRPIDNVRAYVLDRALQPVPVGVAGELCLAGVGLARGYLGRPAETAERFLPDPFADAPGLRLYRTGDRARRLATGEIEYLGRLDRQVKVRGVRVEPAEVEQAITGHPGVAEAVVVAERDDARTRLLAFVRARRDRAVSPGDLRAFLRERVPTSMIPDAIVAVDAFPLTANGKVDRGALQAPAAAGRERAPTPPATPDEEALASIWAAVLGVSGVGRHDDFFELGGHSLAAMRVVARVREALGVRLPLEVVFEAGSLAAMAERIAVERAAEAAEPPLLPAPRDAAIPTSFGQERLWFLRQLSPGDAAYHMPVQVRLRGELDVRALERALNEIVDRHEVLRTSLADDGTRQVVRLELRLRLEPVTPRGGRQNREAEAARLLREEALRPFDLEGGPLIRAALLRLGLDDHVLSIVVHHAVFDGWSVNLFFEELSGLYRAFRAGRPSPLPAPRLQYGDFASWQRAWLRSPVFERQLAYWKAELLGAAPVLDLPTDQPRPPHPSSRGGRAWCKVRPGATAALRRLSREENVTLFTALLAGFQVLLARCSGRTDVLVGTPVAGRGRAELESMVGLFVNTVVLRGDLSGNPGFRELLARDRRAVVGALANQDLPFERLVEALNVRRDPRHTPLCQVLLVLNSTAAGPQLDGLEISGYGADVPVTKFDLTLTVTDAGEFLAGRLDYRRDLFEPTTAKRLVRGFAQLLEAAASDPDRAIQDLPMPGVGGDGRRDGLLTALAGDHTVEPSDR